MLVLEVEDPLEAPLLTLGVVEQREVLLHPLVAEAVGEAPLGLHRAQHREGLRRVPAQVSAARTARARSRAMPRDLVRASSAFCARKQPLMYR